MSFLECLTRLIEYGDGSTGIQAERVVGDDGRDHQPASHPFYAKVNEVLADCQFDLKAEQLCERFCKPVKGRPSITPGVYFRALLIGYRKDISSE